MDRQYWIGSNGAARTGVERRAEDWQQRHGWEQSGRACMAARARLVREKVWTHMERIGSRGANGHRWERSG